MRIYLSLLNTTITFKLYAKALNPSDNYPYYGDNLFVKARKTTPTSAVAPTSLAVGQTVAEGGVTLSWSGAADGTANPITGYELQYSDSADCKAWGAWAALQTVSSTATSGSVTVKPPDTRGHYRRFQVRALTKNTSYLSGWKVSDNTLRRNVLPVSPTDFTAEPEAYTTEDITLKWSGAVAGTSPIKQYIIQKAESPDSTAWGSWQTEKTVVTPETSGSVVVSPTRTLDTYTRYRICVQDTLGCICAYYRLCSNYVYSLARPFAPLLTAPKASSATYSRNPKVLIKTEAPPGAKEQAVFVKGADGVTYNSVDHPDMFSVSGTATKAVKTIFTNPDAAPGSFSVSAHCATVDAGPAVTRGFTVAASPFAEKIEAGAPVKAANITELRSAANAVRNYFGLAAFPWAQPVTAGRTNTSYWPHHILELREAVNEVVELLAEYGGAIKIDWHDIGRGRPRADVMRQLEHILLNL